MSTRWKAEVTSGRSGSAADSHLDELWFGEPHSCYETHSVFEGRVNKWSLDHSFKTVLGTVRHWGKEKRKRVTSRKPGKPTLTLRHFFFLCNSPLFRDLKLPMNLTYSYTGGSLGWMVPRSMWQQNSSWFFAGGKGSENTRSRRKNWQVAESGATN